MADVTPYADHQKALLIAQLSQLPNGVQDFLTTEIPDPPSISTPGDVDSAIIANGICAQYVLDLFRPFAGLTPVEMLMRISQLNDWNNAGVLAGLQQWGGASVDGGGETGSSDERSDFKIFSPPENATVEPGTVLFCVKATAGTLKTVHVMPTGGVASGPGFYLEEHNGEFWAGTYVNQIGLNIYEVTGTFADGRSPVVKEGQLTVTDDGTGTPGEVGSGEDLTGLDLAKKVFDEEAREILSNIPELFVATASDSFRKSRLGRLVAASNRVLAVAQAINAKTSPLYMLVKAKIEQLMGQV